MANDRLKKKKIINTNNSSSTINFKAKTTLLVHNCTAQQEVSLADLLFLCNDDVEQDFQVSSVQTWAYWDLAPLEEL